MADHLIQQYSAPLRRDRGPCQGSGGPAAHRAAVFLPASREQHNTTAQCVHAGRAILFPTVYPPSILKGLHSLIPHPGWEARLLFQTREASTGGKAPPKSPLIHQCGSWLTASCQALRTERALQDRLQPSHIGGGVGEVVTEGSQGTVCKQ